MSKLPLNSKWGQQKERWLDIEEREEREKSSNTGPSSSSVISSPSRYPTSSSAYSSSSVISTSTKSEESKRESLESAPILDVMSAPKIISTEKTSDGTIRKEELIQRDEKGRKIKITRTIKTVVRKQKVNKNVAARRKWAKFGDCKDAAPGPEANVTMMDNQEVRVVKPSLETVDDVWAQARSQKTSVVTCRFCGGPHMSMKCPKNRGESLSSSSSSAPRGDTESSVSSNKPRTGTYIAPHSREGEKGTSGSSSRGASSMRSDEPTLRVTNLSEDTTEADLKDLFGRFGYTRRVFLAKDKQTGKSRGFAFINFDTKASAEEAIRKLDGYGYDNLILQVEWAKPREERPEGSSSSSTAPSSGGRF
eukprot:TRINITY_DN5337_c0_g1_i1.p1 TRINITY_DN5337_c0_g1~~TRINITY_DN5337_c0_g1_i1.p1  ORF type:complete len:364 (+),score=110.85 TRINITY_DN5337_c0_g1_i1:66-1157(+)